MTLHDGLLLLGVVVALYLYDSALLLYHNEVLLIATSRGYRVSAGSGIELGGRHVFVPAPFSPHRIAFRLSWPGQGVYAGAGQALRFRRVRIASAALAPWIFSLLALFAIGLPYVLFVSGNVEALLAWAAAVYAVILVTLWQVYRLRKALNMSRRAVLAIALDALLCAPFALNIVRKIGLRQQSDVDLRVLASTALSSAALDELTAILRQRIQASLHFIEPDDAQARALGAYLAYFEGLRP
ncbi:hypothetical protein [Dyella mobilis]|uniref:Uncharacterized protein n=1 Tax=Dyella mobilis TaxID=1849582 RepID=A0ABS2KBU2_9GAMM|nr:hypothetical protein [Dyella mobilis]MBM7128647.1 hypothetical protein [Dyella mobilis]GLQ99448.1 hypothetical protein GCM10007863_38680 [Dyella mobilis]